MGPESRPQVLEVCPDAAQECPNGTQMRQFWLHFAVICECHFVAPLFSHFV